MSGIYVAEYQRDAIRVARPLRGGHAQRRPFDRDRRVRLRDRRPAVQKFTALAGGLALGHHDDSDHHAHDRGTARLVPMSLREGALALGATRGRAVFTVVLPAALPGIVTGVVLALARIAGETAPLLFTSFNNRFWSTTLTRADGVTHRPGLHLRDCAVRRLASPGVGRRAGARHARADLLAPRPSRDPTARADARGTVGTGPFKLRTFEVRLQAAIISPVRIDPAHVRRAGRVRGQLTADARRPRPWTARRADVHDRAVATGAVTLALLVRSRGGARRLPGGSGRPALSLAGYAVAFTLAYTRIGAAIGALLLFGAVQVTMIGIGTRARRAAAPDRLAGHRARRLPDCSCSRCRARPRRDPLGAALMAGAGVCWGLYSLAGRGSRDPLATTAGNFGRPLVLAADRPRPRCCRSGHVTTSGLLLAAASGSLASGVGYTLWYTVAAVAGRLARGARADGHAGADHPARGGLSGRERHARLLVATALVAVGVVVTTHRPQAAGR